MEDLAGFRDYLFCVGIHISRNSCWRPRSSAAHSSGDAFPGCGTRSLRLDDRARRTLTECEPMNGSIVNLDPDLFTCHRTVFLGRTTRAFLTFLPNYCPP